MLLLQQSTAGPGDFEIFPYAHREVDRFGVMMDLWSNETAFMECKREVRMLFFIFHCKMKCTG